MYCYSSAPTNISPGICSQSRVIYYILIIGRKRRSLCICMCTPVS